LGLDNDNYLLHNLQDQTLSLSPIHAGEELVAVQANNKKIADFSAIFFYIFPLP
jgi:hypothetical protein